MSEQTEQQKETQEKGRAAFQKALSEVADPSFFTGMEPALAEQIKTAAEYLFMQGVIYGSTRLANLIHDDMEKTKREKTDATTHSEVSGG